MRRLVVTMSAAVALIGAGAVAPPADAALSRGKALKRAESTARQHAREDRRITDWEITRGFRFSDRKWVWAWWAQLGDGRICSAQLVTRYNSSKTNKLIGYFRNEDCG
jgi:hypothetical protein